MSRPAGFVLPVGCLGEATSGLLNPIKSGGGHTCTNGGLRWQLREKNPNFFEFAKSVLKLLLGIVLKVESHNIPSLMSKSSKL